MKNLSRLTALLLALVMLLSITASATEISNYTKADYDADVVAAKSQTEITAPGVLTAEHNGFSFAVEGEVPETAQLYVTHMGDDTAANIRTNILSLPELEEGMSEYAFDITIVNDNAEWQPGTPVEVTINGLDTTSDSFVQVYHIPDSQPAVATLSLMDEDTTPAMTFEEVEATPGDGTVTFMADGFSTYYVVAGKKSITWGNHTVNVLPGATITITNFSSSTYTVTPADGFDMSGIEHSYSDRTLTFTTTAQASIGSSYTIKASGSNNTITVNIVAPKTIFAQLEDVAPRVYLTVLKSSNSVPAEPMEGASGYEWYYITQRNNGTYSFSTTQYGNKYSTVCEDVIDYDKVATSSQLRQNIEGKNVVGVVDTGWGVDTLPCIKFTSEKWREVLTAIRSNSTAARNVYISGTDRTLSSLTDAEFNEKNGDGTYRYQIYPYVVKMLLDGWSYGSEADDGWHIDCCVVDTQKVSVIYDINMPSTSQIIESQNVTVPAIQFYVVGKTGVPVGQVKLGNTAVTSEITITVLNTADNSTAEYTFMGWNTKADGSGTSYMPGDTLPELTDDVTLYAIWSAENTSGTLKIEKVEAFDAGADTTSAGSVEYTFNVKFEPSNDVAVDALYPYAIYQGITKVGEGNLTNNGTIAIKGGQNVVINGAPAGNVSVTEVSVGDYSTSWMISNPNTTAESKTAEGVIIGAQQTNLICTNRYETKTGTLTVTKKGLSAGESALFTVTVEEGSTVYKTFDIALSAEDNEVTFADLPAGAVCTVAESGDWSWRYAKTIYDNNGVAIVAGGNVKITVENSERTDKWLSDESAKVNTFATVTE